jgi:hypothetical protein
LLAALLVAAPRAATAQSAPLVTTVDVSSAAVTPIGASTFAGLAATLRASQDHGRWQWSSHVGLGTGGTGGAAAAAGGLLTIAPMALRGLALTIDADGARFANVVSTSGATARLGVRAAWQVGEFTLLPGASTAITTRSGLTRRVAQLADVTLQWRRGDWRLSAFGGRHANTDWPLMEASGFALTRPAGAYVLVDRGAGVEWGRATRRVGLTLTDRVGLGATAGRDASWVASAEWPLSRRMTGVALAGDVLADPLRSTVAGQLLAVGVRAVLGGAGPPPVARGAASVRLSERGGIVTIELTAVGPPDQLLEWTASYLDWVPQPFRWERGRWVARATIPGGRHRVAVRTASGTWEAPAGAPAVPDDLGGSAALVVVP